jgi:hypothetical protein
MSEEKNEGLICDDCRTENGSCRPFVKKGTCNLCGLEKYLWEARGRDAEKVQERRAKLQAAADAVPPEKRTKPWSECAGSGCDHSSHKTLQGETKLSTPTEPIAVDTNDPRPEMRPIELLGMLDILPEMGVKVGDELPVRFEGEPADFLGTVIGADAKKALIKVTPMTPEKMERLKALLETKGLPMSMGTQSVSPVDDLAPWNGCPGGDCDHLIHTLLHAWMIVPPGVTRPAPGAYVQVRFEGSDTLVCARVGRPALQDGDLPVTASLARIHPDSLALERTRRDDPTLVGEDRYVKCTYVDPVTTTMRAKLKEESFAPKVVPPDGEQTASFPTHDPSHYIDGQEKLKLIHEPDEHLKATGEVYAHINWPAGAPVIPGSEIPVTLGKSKSKTPMTAVIAREVDKGLVMVCVKNPSPELVKVLETQSFPEVSMGCRVPDDRPPVTYGNEHRWTEAEASNFPRAVLGSRETMERVMQDNVELTRGTKLDSTGPTAEDQITKAQIDAGERPDLNPHKPEEFFGVTYKEPHKEAKSWAIYVKILASLLPARPLLALDREGMPLIEVNLEDIEALMKTNPLEQIQALTRRIDALVEINTHLLEKVNQQEQAQAKLAELVTQPQTVQTNDTKELERRIEVILNVFFCEHVKKDVMAGQARSNGMIICQPCQTRAKLMGRNLGLVK